MFALAGWEMRLHPVSQNNARDRPKRHEHGRRSSIEDEHSDCKLTWNLAQCSYESTNLEHRLIHYTLTSVCLFSTLFSLRFLKAADKENLSKNQDLLY